MQFKRALFLSSGMQLPSGFWKFRLTTTAATLWRRTAQSSARHEGDRRGEHDAQESPARGVPSLLAHGRER